MHKLFSSTFVFFVTFLFISAAFAQGVVHTFEVQGNKRVETPTVLSYLKVKPGVTLSEEKIEEILKDLFATGLFADVVLDQQGDKLIIKVVENKIINRIAFEGNSKIKDEVFEAELRLKPREVYTAGRVQEAAQKIRDMYRLSGRYGAKVVPKIIEREQNRVDLIFEIDEGKLTRINKIIFVGNNHFSSSRLSSVILTKESKWYRFFSSDDVYDPDRLAFDKELLRKYYNEHGYADFKVESVVAELDPDEQEFYITYTVDEGKRYHFGKVKITVNLPKLNCKDLEKAISFEKGDWFDSKEIEKTINELNNLIGEKGFAFVEIEPKLTRHPKTCTVDIEIVVKEGRHVFINRIDIVGNDRTDDEVVRREFRIAEGDPYNSVKLKRSEQRIRDLDFFKTVDIKPEETAVPDKVDLKVEVEDKPTGSLQFSGGYSTQDGPIGTISMNERNLMGKGYDLYGNATISKRAMDYHTGLIDPYFLGRPLSGGVDVFHSSRKYDTQKFDRTRYKQTKTGGNFSLGYDLTEYLGQSFSYELRRELINDVPRTASYFIQKQKGTWFASSVGHNLFYNKRDNSIDPTSGYFAALSDELAGLGGNVRYFKNGVRTGVYYSLDEASKWVVSGKAHGGAMCGLNGSTRVVDRYDLGGETLRGFSDNGIGPRDKITRDALGGLFFYKFTAELNVPLGLPEELGFKGSLFTDVGSVWHIGEKSRKVIVIANTAKPRIGAGAGVMWRSPMGPIGFYYAPWAKGVKGDIKRAFNVTFGTNF